MPAPINVELRGWLDFFGLKNGGANPQLLGTSIAPTMDMQRWYMESRARLDAFPLANVVASRAPTASQIAVVPNHEVWILVPGTAVVMQMSANAGTVVSARLFCSGNGQQPQWLPMDQSSDLYSQSSATNVREYVRTLSSPVWLPPSAIVYIRDDGITIGAGGSVTPSAYLKTVRLRI